MMSQVDNELIRVNNQLCNFSEDGQFLAVAFQTNLVIKNCTNFDTFQSFLFSDIIEYLEWSRNSEFVLCANIKKAIVQVYSIYYPQWKCKLVEGSAGLESVSWSPDSKHILTVSDFNIQICVWSLENRSVSHIQNIKSSAFDRLNFSPNGNRLALIATDDGQDSVQIYRIDNWKLSRKLICERLNSIDGICWSPNSELLCIWCSSSGEPKLIIYSTRLETNIAVFCPTKQADLPNTLNYGKELKGIENVVWMVSGQLLAIAGFNEMIVLLNHVTWKPLLQLYLDPVIRDNNYLNKVYEERVVQTKSSSKHALSCNKHTLEEQHERPINIRIGRKLDNDKLSIAKTEILEFSACGQYLAIKHQLYPTTLWIWNVVSDYVDYLLLESDIVAAKWNPKKPQLLILCECAYMFEWSPHAAKCISTPKNITVLDAKWHPQGEFVLLCGYNKAVIYNIENECQ